MRAGCDFVLARRSGLRCARESTLRLITDDQPATSKMILALARTPASPWLPMAEEADHLFRSLGNNSMQWMPLRWLDRSRSLYLFCLIWLHCFSPLYMLYWYSSVYILFISISLSCTLISSVSFISSFSQDNYLKRKAVTDNWADLTSMITLNQNESRDR